MNSPPSKQIPPWGVLLTKNEAPFSQKMTLSPFYLKIKCPSHKWFMKNIQILKTAKIAINICALIKQHWLMCWLKRHPLLNFKESAPPSQTIQKCIHCLPTLPIPLPLTLFRKPWYFTIFTYFRRELVLVFDLIFCLEFVKFSKNLSLICLV